MAFYHRWLGEFRRIMALSTEEATRWQRALKYSIDLARHCARELKKDNATQMAAALTYHTLFGLVPLLVLGLILFRAFGGFDNLGEEIEHRLYDYMGVSPIAVEVVDPDHDPELVAGAEPPPEDLIQAHSVREIIGDLEERIGEINYAVIGITVFPVLIWASIGLLVTIETAFNQIYAASRGRTWAMRVPVYWAVITLGPLLAGLSLWLTGQVVGWIAELDVYVPTFVQWLLDALSRGAALLVTWVLLTLLYVLLPNTAVRLRAAMIGAVVAAVMWELAKWGFQLYVDNAVTYSVLYGSLGLIPLFLIWVYLSWLIVLFGLELTYTLQTLPAKRRGFESRREQGDLLFDPRWLIPMMAAIGEAFERGEPVSGDDLAHRLSLPIVTVTRLAQTLETHHLIHEVDGTRGTDVSPGYALAMPPQRIGLGRLLEVGESLAMDRRALRRAPAHRVLQTLDAAQHQAADRLTLADVLANEKEGEEGERGEEGRGKGEGEA